LTNLKEEIMNRAMVRFAVLAFFLAALPVAAQSGAWSSVGSTGSIDETALGIYAVNGPALQHQAAATGTVFARYNVTNTFGGGLTDAPAWNTPLQPSQRSPRINWHPLESWRRRG
jgi:hypothetical protein